MADETPNGAFCHPSFGCDCGNEQTADRYWSHECWGLGFDGEGRVDDGLVDPCPDCGMTQAAAPGSSAIASVFASAPRPWSHRSAGYSHAEFRTIVDANGDEVAEADEPEAELIVLAVNALPCSDSQPTLSAPD